MLLNCYKIFILGECRDDAIRNDISVVRITDARRLAICYKSATMAHPQTKEDPQTKTQGRIHVHAAVSVGLAR